MGYTTNWKSSWFSRKKYKEFLKQDYYLREFILNKLKQAAVEGVEIKRSANSLNIIIRAARPGIIISRGGSGISELKKEIMSKILKDQAKGLNIKIDIEELKKPETYARIIALNVAEQLEGRRPFRRVIKQTLEKTMHNSEVQGAKIHISGRLGGSEMAREEWLKIGKMPLQTLRAIIDYAQINAHTTYGIIGVKVWIYKGEKFG